MPNGWFMVDDSDVIEVEVPMDDEPASLPFQGREATPSHVDVSSVLQAADDACRRMEVLARELECLIDPEGDDSGPRAA